jgi:hypothetical protein
MNRVVSSQSRVASEVLNQRTTEKRQLYFSSSTERRKEARRDNQDVPGLLDQTSSSMSGTPGCSTMSLAYAR